MYMPKVRHTAQDVNWAHWAPDMQIAGTVLPPRCHQLLLLLCCQVRLPLQGPGLGVAQSAAAAAAATAPAAAAAAALVAAAAAGAAAGCCHRYHQGPSHHHCCALLLLLLPLLQLLPAVHAQHFRQA
jgi:hypothetical protein